MSAAAHRSASSDEDDAQARRWLLAATLVLLVARGLLALALAGPLVVSDELGYLTNARVLTGGEPAELLTTAIYRGGYSMLLMPALALSDDPITAYRLVLLENVVLLATLPVLLYVLLRRCFGVPPRRAAIAAVAGACYPSLTHVTGNAMSENLLVPLAVAWLICFGSLLDTRGERARLGWAVALGLTAALLWTTHGRMVVAVGLTAAAVVWLASRRRLSVPVAASALAATAAGLLLGRTLNEHLIRTNYGGQHQDEAGMRLEVLTHLDDALSAARNLAGQGWYLLVATLGLALVLVVADGRRLPRALRARDASASDLTLALLLLTAAGLLVVSALSFPSPARPDQMVYGRYVEVVAPMLLALGVTRLFPAWPARRLAVAAGALLGLTALVAVLRHGLDVTANPDLVNVAAFPLPLGMIGPSRIAAAGVIAAACLVVLATLARRRAWALGPVLLLLLLAPAALSERELVRTSQANYPAGWTGPDDAFGDRRPARVGYDVDRERGEYFGGLKYTWFLTRSVLVHFSGRAATPPSRYVISSGAWPREHPDYPASALWRDPARDQTLWRLEAEPLAPLRRLETCLSRAGLATRRLGPAERPTGVEVPGAGARIALRPSSAVAAGERREAARLLAAAGRDDVVVTRRGRLLATLPRAPAGRVRTALTRCV